MDELPGGVSERPTMPRQRLMRTPRDFEEAAADWMRAWGLTSVTLSPDGPDGGVDVESREAVAQVKAWMAPVGSPDVQRLRGAAYDGRVPLFFSLTGYTPAAVRFADQASVALFRFSTYGGDVEAVNESAMRFLGGRADARAASMSMSVRDLVLDCIRVVGDPNGNETISALVAARPTGRFVEIRRIYAGTRFFGLHLETGRCPAGDMRAGTCTGHEIDRLLALGWAPHTLERSYGLPRPHTEIADLVVQTLVEIGGARSGRDIEITYK